MGFCSTPNINSGNQYAHNLQEKKNEVLSYMTDKHVFTSTRTTCVRMFITKLLIGNTNTCVYHFIIHNSHINPSVTVIFLIMYGLYLFFNLKVYIAHMIYGWNFSHSNSVTIMEVTYKY